MKVQSIAIALLMLTTAHAKGPGDVEPQMPEAPTERAIPAFAVAIGVGIAATAAVELFKGIEKAIRGDLVPQVHVAAQTDGPLQSDFALEGDDDKVDAPFGLEWRLYATAYARAMRGHSAFADMNYFHYDRRGWLPRWGWSGHAKASSYSSPGIKEPAATMALAVGAFGINGKIRKEFQIEDTGIAQIPGGGRANGPEGGYEEDWYVESLALGNLAYSVGRFEFEYDLQSPAYVRVRPAGYSDENGNFLGCRIDVLHSVSTIGKPAPILMPFNGIDHPQNPLSDTMDSIAAEIWLAAEGSADLCPGDTHPLDLTINGAAVELHQRFMNPYDDEGNVMEPYEVLVKYFEADSSWDIVPPSRAQVGFEPNVIYTGVASTLTETVLEEGTLPEELAGQVPEPVHGGLLESGVNTPQTDLVTLTFAVHGTLEDAVTLGANTPGHPVAELLGRGTPGETFELEIWISSTSTGYGSDVGQATPLCPSDTDMNGETDVLDLLCTICDWGLECEEGCSGDINNDSNVDILDLLQVINDWGECPEPTGACCGGSTCLDDVTEEYCVNAGGEFQGSDTLCEYECFITGACCMSYDHCVDAWTESACVAAGGSWQGQDVLCSEATGCLLSNGLCCAGGTCYELTEEECANSGGMFYGDNASCEQGVCDYQACCIDSDCYMADPSACVYYGGTVGPPGEYCNSMSCKAPPTGACCMWWHECLDTLTESACLDAGGSWYGHDVLCSETTGCSYPYGACCVDGSCQEMDTAACANLSGIFLGEDSVCKDGACDARTCCIDSYCSMEHPTDCVFYGGTVGKADETCDDDPCTQGVLSACCVPGDGCHMTTEEDCVGQNASFFEGIECVAEGRTEADPCYTYGACCVDYESGWYCHDNWNIYQCTSVGGIYQGDYTWCNWSGGIGTCD